jgi:hypothetical protein
MDPEIISKMTKVGANQTVLFGCLNNGELIYEKKRYNNLKNKLWGIFIENSKSASTNSSSKGSITGYVWMSSYRVIRQH